MRHQTVNAMLVLIAIAALAVFSFVFVRVFLYLPDAEIPVPPQVGGAGDPNSHPVRLVIPAIGVDADVVPVGINAAGNMATPSAFDDAGWYKYGPSPGGQGSAVIAGHVDNGLGLPGVFVRLSELAPGDDVYVESAGGERRHFKVVSVRAYPYEDAPEAVIFNPAGSVRLNLVTCEGRWIAEDKTYDERLVVFTRPANE